MDDYLKTTGTFWNNKYPKQEIIYAGRGIRNYNNRIPIDVRRMVWPDDYILKSIIKSNNLQKSTFDESAHACQQFVVRLLRYVGDKESAGLEECWQFPNETVAIKTGDCEDGAILMASLILNCGVPSWRIRVTAGLVQSAPTAPKGGHAYVTYCRETDNNWVVLDWCYYQDSRTPIKSKPIANTVSIYKDIWFSFNNEFSWSHKQFDVISGIKEKPKVIKKRVEDYATRCIEVLRHFKRRAVKRIRTKEKVR